MTRERQASDETDPALVVLGRYAGHGLTIAAATGAFLLAGWWADGRLGTTPILTIIGALVGAAGGFYSMLQHLLFFPKREREQAETRAREPEGRSGEDEGGSER